MAESATSPSKPKRSQGSRSAERSKAVRNTGSRSAGASRSSASRSKSTSGSRPSRSSASRPPSSRSGGARGSSRPATAKKAGAVAGAAKKGRGPLLAAGAAAAAAAGGALLKHQRSSKGRKILGVSAPKLNLNGVVSRRGLDVKPIGKQVANAGDLIVTASHRVSKISGDAERVGRAAKKLGDSIS